jgi:hypothetical protein
MFAFMVEVSGVGAGSVSGTSCGWGIAADRVASMNSRRFWE